MKNTFKGHPLILPAFYTVLCIKLRLAKNVKTLVTAKRGKGDLIKHQWLLMFVFLDLFGLLLDSFGLF